VAERRVMELDEAPRWDALPRSGGTAAAAGAVVDRRFGRVGEAGRTGRTPAA